MKLWGLVCPGDSYFFRTRIVLLCVSCVFASYCKHRVFFLVTVGKSGFSLMHFTMNRFFVHYIFGTNFLWLIRTVAQFVTRQRSNFRSSTWSHFRQPFWCGQAANELFIFDELASPPKTTGFIRNHFSDSQQLSRKSTQSYWTFPWRSFQFEVRFQAAVRFRGMVIVTALLKGYSQGVVRSLCTLHLPRTRWDEFLSGERIIP